MLYINILILFGLLILSGCFSGTETALMTLSRFKVNTLLRQKKKGAEALKRLKDNQHRLIITILIGNNLVNIAAASLATIIAVDMLGSKGAGVATGVMTFLVLVFGEITPKTIATYHASKISLAVAPIIEALQIILFPFVKFFEFQSGLMTKYFAKGKENPLSEDELRSIVSMGKDEGILSKEAAEMMHNLLEFEGTVVREIMTPETEVKSIDGSQSINEIIDVVVKAPYTRYPVYSTDKDNIIGIVEVNDVLIAAKNKHLTKKVKNIAKPILFVPETKEIDDLLTEFEGSKIPMAMVVDEYGSVAGVVTVEDILEEIVGEIFDKSKKNKDLIQKVKDNEFLVNAKTPVDEVVKEIKLDLQESDFYDTMAGYVENKLQKIPKSGELIETTKAKIIVESANPRGIKSLRIVKKTKK